MRGSRSTGIAVALFMLSVLLLFTFPLWSGGNLLYMGDITNSDVTELNFPARYLIHKGLHEGSLPFWTQRIGCGFPLLAEGQSGMLYPLNLMLFFFFKPVLAFNLSVIISLSMAFIFSYLLFRQYGLSRAASLYSAIAFSFSGYIMAKVKFSYMVNSIAWLPLAVYGVERACARRNLRFFLLTAFAFAMQILAGGAQVFAISLAAALAILLWRITALRSGRPAIEKGQTLRTALALLIAFAIALMLGLGFAAPQLIPQVSGYPQFNRSTGTDFAWSLGKPMRPRNLVQFFSPYQYGNPAQGTYDLDYDYFWENIAYSGLLTLVLSLVAILFLAKRNGDIKLWVAIGVFSLLIALGGNTPLGEVLWRYVPGFRMFRFWQRFLILTVMCLAFLSGTALDHVLKRLRDGRSWRHGIAILAILVLVIDLGMFAKKQVSTIDSGRIFEGSELSAWLKDNLGDDPGYRISVLGEKELWEQTVRKSRGWLGDKKLFYRFMELMPPNHNIYFDIDGVTQYGDYGLYYPKVLDSLTHFVFLAEKEGRVRYTRSAVNILAVEGAKYLLTPYEMEVEGLTKARTLETGIAGAVINVYEISDPLPRAYVASTYEVIERSPLPLQQLIETMYDGKKARERVILEEEPARLDAREAMEGRVHIRHYGDSRVELDVASATGGILVLNTSHYPEWDVYVNGERRRLLRANYAFMGVELEPGSHRVEFIYRPRSLYHGIYVLIASLFLALSLWLHDRRSRFSLLDHHRANAGHDDGERSAEAEPAGRDGMTL